MASRMIGRATCPECGFESAHVKESEKCLYRYCPECGSQHYAKSQRQRADLTKKTRVTATATEQKEAPAATVPEATATATATNTVATGSDASATTTPAPAKRRGLFS